MPITSMRSQLRHDERSHDLARPRHARLSSADPFDCPILPLGHSGTQNTNEFTFTNRRLLRQTSFAFSEPIVEAVCLELNNTGLEVASAAAFLPALPPAVLDKTAIA
jgi:hypothetical protein